VERAKPSETLGVTPLDHLTGRAPAKINLALHVTGKRADGYHLLDSLVVFADVWDSLAVSRSRTPGIALSVDGPFAEGVPTGPANLIWRAAQAVGLPEDGGVAVHLTKRLPHAAGIGGGSADAAAMLRLMASLCDRPLPDPAAVLALGADVPVCLHGCAVRMGGIGDTLTEVPDLPPIWAVLVNPGVAVPTGAVFARLADPERPPLPALPDTWADAETLLAWLARTRNDLQEPARAECRPIGRVLQTLGAAVGCRLARMSGSGATCFGLFTDPDAARHAARTIAEAEPAWWVVPARLS